MSVGGEVGAGRTKYPSSRKGREETGMAQAAKWIGTAGVSQLSSAKTRGVDTKKPERRS